MYADLAPAGVLPRKRATSLIARVLARLRAVFDPLAAGPETASALAASTVPLQVRKSLALKPPPAASLTYWLMSVDLTSIQRRPSLYARSSLPPPRRLFNCLTTSTSIGSPIARRRF